MSSTPPVSGLLRTGSIGRGFACMDPERQSEISADAFRPRPARPTTARPATPARTDWTRLQFDRDYEGGSSRHGR